MIYKDRNFNNALFGGLASPSGILSALHGKTFLNHVWYKKCVIYLRTNCREFSYPI